LQEALQAAPSDQAREILAAELHGHVVRAMRCPHANHVLQKCIMVMQPKSLQFIVDELMARNGTVAQAAKHRYACRVIQHMLTKCPASQTAELAEALIRDAKVLACHTIGHFSIKQLLEIGTQDQRYRLIRVLEQNMRSISLSAIGGCVVRAALSYADAEDKIWIARAVLQDTDAVLSLASHRHGNVAVLQLLQTLNDPEQRRLREVLMKHHDQLGSSKFGRAVVERLVSPSSPSD